MTKTFEQVLEQEKKELTEALIPFGEGKRVRKALADLEMNRPEFYKFYEAGQQSLQAEIDELNLKINRLIESEENIARSCKGWRDAHRELDERIIKALDMLEGREGKVLFEDILDVLKGGTND